MSLNRIALRLGLILMALAFLGGLGTLFVRHALAGMVSNESRLTLGGIQSGSASYVQPDSIIGQDVIIGIGASLHYSAEPAFITPASLVVYGRRTAAELWALYE